MGRKAWLFAGSENGARNTAILLGLIVSCKLAGVDPFAWLQDVLSRIATYPADRVGELIPREWKKRHASQTTPVAPAA